MTVCWDADLRQLTLANVEDLAMSFRLGPQDLVLFINRTQSRFRVLEMKWGVPGLWAPATMPGRLYFTMMKAFRGMSQCTRFASDAEAFEAAAHRAEIRQAQHQRHVQYSEEYGEVFARAAYAHFHRDSTSGKARAEPRRKATKKPTPVGCPCGREGCWDH